MDVLKYAESWNVTLLIKIMYKFCFGAGSGCVIVDRRLYRWGQHVFPGTLMHFYGLPTVTPPPPPPSPNRGGIENQKNPLSNQ